MPRPPKGAKTTEPSETQGSNPKGPSYLTRSVSAAKAALDTSKDNSNLSDLEPQEQRFKQIRSRGEVDESELFDVKMDLNRQAASQSRDRRAK